MMNLIRNEFDERNVGNGSLKASRIMQSTQQSNTELKQSLLHHLFGSSNTTNTDSLQNIINQTILNPGSQTMTESNNGQQNKVHLISKDDGVWAHYWDGHLHPIPRSFVCSKNQTLLRLW